MAKKDKNRVLPRHKFWFAVGRFIARFFICPSVHFKSKQVKVDKKTNYLILSNHQANLDPIFLASCFKRPIYLVSSEHIFYKGFVSKLLVHCFAPIQKKKSALDIKCILDMQKTAKEGGSIAIFVEGNRTWTNCSFPISKSCVKLVRSLNLPLILFNLKGGFGVDPRWGNKTRKGPFTGEARYILSLEQIKNMSDDELYDVISSSLAVSDSSNGEIYKSKKRAEYLERFMFVCDCCHKKNTLLSSGNYIKCQECGNEYEYTETLKLRNTKTNEEKSLFDYYQFQAREVLQDKISSNEVLLKDDNVILYDQLPTGRKLISEGQISLTEKFVSIGDFRINIDDITSISLISGDKLTINTNENGYIVIGQGRINFMKYVFYIEKISPLLFNKEDYYAIHGFNS